MRLLGCVLVGHVWLLTFNLGSGNQVGHRDRHISQVVQVQQDLRLSVGRNLGLPWRYVLGYHLFS